MIGVQSTWKGIPVRKLILTLIVFLAAGATAAHATSIYDFTMKSIDGQPVSLKTYSGKVVLLVNVASKCGFTPQYAGLEALYEKYKDLGLVIVGVPANNFGSQEPGTNEEIKKFCSNKYNVTFPMMAKVSVLGDDKTPLYQYLTDKSQDPQFGGDIVVATTDDGRAFVQFSKTPLTIATAQLDPKHWQLSFPQMGKAYEGRRPPPALARRVWLYLPDALAGKPSRASSGPAAGAT